MSSLLAILSRVKEIPSYEFLSKAGEGERARPIEMALLSEIIPRDKILEIRQKKGYWISRCCDLTPTRIKFQVTNGTTHTIVLSCEGGKPKIVDNREILGIDTVEDLRGHILALAGVK